MNKNLVDKIKPSHLGKIAYLYVRQSTVRQVFENSESTERQYALRQRAINLGWSEDQVVVIDSDLGQSGSGAVKREGFQKLVTEVGMGRAGIVLGLEVSRLARNSVDWHRLVEFCALTDTLILDEDGVYDPSQFNDRLLLGLKGTMSEAELHVLHSRLRGGLLNKARRGELRLFLPIGFVYDNMEKIALDPDQQIQETIRLFFKTYERTGSRHRQVQRAQYEADSAKHRYMHVDPTNRLVAESLEAEWNEKLRKLIAIKEENQRQRKTDNLTISENQKEKILQLATDFPSLWNEVNTPNRERKKMLGLLIEDVTLIKAKQITMSIRFRGGACQILTIPRPLTYNQMRVTNAEVRQMISTLLDEYTDSRIAQTLNERGMVTGAGEVFDHQSVKWIRHTNKLRSLKQRLIENGWVSNREMCKLLNSSRDKINKKRIEGELNARLCNDNGEWLYWPPGRGVQSTEIEFSQLNTPTGQGAL